MICALTGLDVANASLYDGATAAAEAMVIAVQATGRTRIAVADTVHPETIAVLRTFGEGRRISVDIVATDNGLLVPEAVRGALTAEHAALLVQYPSFAGTIQDLAPLAAAAHDAGAIAT